MATRMHLDRPIVETRDVLTYRVLARDQPALVDLVCSVLDPLREARGGAEPLVETLAAYFDPGVWPRRPPPGFICRCGR